MEADRPPNVKAKLTEVNSYLTCPLCKGYYIDATTIVECLHSYCRSCIIQHLQQDPYCPICELMINTAKPNIKADKTLQDIVYKLVPGLYASEMARRRRFWAERPADAAKVACPEARGLMTERIIFSPQDAISLSIEYISDEPTCAWQRTEPDQDVPLRRYLQCPAMLRVEHLKKFICNKYNVDNQLYHVDILYKRVPLPDHYTLMDIAYIYSWKRNEPMKFYFRITDIALVSERFDYFEPSSKSTPLPLPRCQQRSIVKQQSITNNNEKKPAPENKNCVMKIVLKKCDSDIKQSDVKKPCSDQKSDKINEKLVNNVSDKVDKKVSETGVQKTKLENSNSINLVKNTADMKKGNCELDYYESKVPINDSSSRENSSDVLENSADSEKSQFLMNIQLTAKNASPPQKKPTSPPVLKLINPQLFTPKLVSTSFPQKRKLKNEKTISAKKRKITDEDWQPPLPSKCKKSNIKTPKSLENESGVKVKNIKNPIVRKFVHNLNEQATNLTKIVGQTDNSKPNRNDINGIKSDGPKCDENILKVAKFSEPKLQSTMIDPHLNSIKIDVKIDQNKMNNEAIKLNITKIYKIEKETKNNPEITVESNPTSFDFTETVDPNLEAKKKFVQNIGNKMKARIVENDIKSSRVGQNKNKLEKIGSKVPKNLKKNFFERDEIKRIAKMRSETKNRTDNQNKQSQLEKSELTNKIDKQNEQLQSLIDSCKINIPSSLSITLTESPRNEDGTIANSKPSVIKPVQNYIEILKLPEINVPETTNQNKTENSDGEGRIDAQNSVENGQNKVSNSVKNSQKHTFQTMFEETIKRNESLKAHLFQIQEQAKNYELAKKSATDKIKSPKTVKKQQNNALDLSMTSPNPEITSQSDFNSPNSVKNNSELETASLSPKITSTNSNNKRNILEIAHQLSKRSKIETETTKVPNIMSPSSAKTSPNSSTDLSQKSPSVSPNLVINTSPTSSNISPDSSVTSPNSNESKSSIIINNNFSSGGSILIKRSPKKVPIPRLPVQKIPTPKLHPPNFRNGGLLKFSNYTAKLASSANPAKPVSKPPSPENSKINGLTPNQLLEKYNISNLAQFANLNQAQFAFQQALMVSHQLELHRMQQQQNSQKHWMNNQNILAHYENYVQSLKNQQNLVGNSSKN